MQRRRVVLLLLRSVLDHDRTERVLAARSSVPTETEARFSVNPDDLLLAAWSVAAVLVWRWHERRLAIEEGRNL
jgi:hypothetical protein